SYSHSSRHITVLHSFPTRRSSDLLGQTDLSIPYPWIRWLELLYRFRGYLDVTSLLLRRTTKIGCPTCLDWSKASCCVPHTRWTRYGTSTSCRICTDGGLAGRPRPRLAAPVHLRYRDSGDDVGLTAWHGGPGADGRAAFRTAPGTAGRPFSRRPHGRPRHRHRRSRAAVHRARSGRRRPHVCLAADHLRASQP